jgi:hypothetical protein
MGNSPDELRLNLNVAFLIHGIIVTVCQIGFWRSRYADHQHLQTIKTNNQASGI